MPRIRTIKPDFFTSETVTALEFRTRLTWIGLWTHCDDHGRHRDNVKLIKAAVWPLDAVSLRDVADDLDDLVIAGLLYRYEVDGRTYLQVTNWEEHQRVDRPSKTTIPAPTEGTVLKPPAADVSAGQHTRETLASPREEPSSPRDGKGGEGKGREGTREAREEPPLRCPRHLEDPDPPNCGACAGARKNHERWQRERQSHLAGLAAGPRCRTHQGQPAHNCALCRSERVGAE